MAFLNSKMMKSMALSALNQAKDDERLAKHPPLKRMVEAFTDVDEKTVEVRDITCEQAKVKIENMLIGTEIVFQDKKGGWHSIIFT